jgi:hypothetical protein
MLVRKLGAIAKTANHMAQHQWRRQGVHVGSSAPDLYTSAPTLYLTLCILIVYLAYQLTHYNTGIHFYYSNTVTASNKNADSCT